MRGARSLRSSGFSLMELMVVIAVIALTMVFVYPRAQRLFDRARVRGARTAIVNMVNAAKIAARQEGLAALFIVNADHISIERGGVTAAQQHLGSAYGVTVTSPADTITFDPRGLVMGAGGTIAIAKSGYTDSVKVDGYGRIRR